MRRFFILVAMFANGMTAFADGSTQYPFLAPKCDRISKVPFNQNGVFYSEDCSTAFVMPDSIGKLTISSVSKGANLGLCESLYTLQDAELKINQQIAKLNAQLAQLPVDDPRFDKTIAQTKKLAESINGIYANYEKVVGGYAQVIFSTSDEQSRIREFTWENIEDVHHGMNVMAAPIQESYISFTPARTDLARNPILDFTISGVKPVNSTTGNVDQMVYRSGMNASGSLTLSLWGICPGRGKPIPSGSDINLNVSPVITYTVPVLSWAAYRASLNNVQAISNVMDVSKTKSQFSATDVETYTLNGAAANSFTFDVINLGLISVYTTDSQKDFLSNLRNEVLTRLTQRLLDEMNAAGFIELTQQSTAVDAPAPGTVDQVRDGGTSCSSSGPFGLFGTSCHHNTYVVKIPVTSTAQTLVVKDPHLNFTNTEAVDMREPVTRIFTTVFKSDAPASAPAPVN